MKTALFQELHSLINSGHNGKLIQFPYFSPEGSPRINHPSIIRLKACDMIGEEDPQYVRLLAWQQIGHLAMEFVDQATSQHVT